MTLLELAERCEAATGPDDALDGAIWLAVLADDNARKAYDEGLNMSRDEAAFRLSYMAGGFRPTASLDAALTLVPEGFRLFSLGEARYMTRSPAFCAQLEIWTSEDGIDGSANRSIGVANTLPLALCVAALRARNEQVTK